MKKMGIMGGTFDPVHRGHISLALDAMKAVGLDEVMLMPAKWQPFKQGMKVTSAEDRLAMLKLATEYISGLTVSTVEMDMEGLSYTYKSLRRIRRELGDSWDMYFITGIDTYLKLGIWKEAESLLSENKFIVGKRPGFDSDELGETIKLYRDIHGTETFTVDNALLDISSTEVRRLISNGEAVNDLLPEGVARYIYDHRLYS